MNVKASLKHEQVIEAMNNISNPRTQAILIARYGLKDGKRQTLESIGKKYSITRERVRQIEETAFSDLRKPGLLEMFSPAFISIDSFFNREGKVAREERLFASLTGCEQSNADWGALYFILTLGKPYQRVVESNKFYTLWSNSDKALEKADGLINQLVSVLEDRKEAVTLNNIIQLAKENSLSLSRRALCSYLDVTKAIHKNNFGRYGLTKWPEISPRGAKDKAYIILKENSQPLHFRQITELINKAGLGNHIARPQTVHNELIKDSRFVLVGRGIYGLKEWGHRIGTVKDIIHSILKEKGPMDKSVILDEVLKDRMVKKNTIFINLQNKNLFTKDTQGRYTLK